MAEASRHDAWQAGRSYDAYMGRWSRKVAPVFLAWLDAPEGLDWVDVGCGTGALSEAILARARPGRVLALDASEGFLAEARRRIDDPRFAALPADAGALPLDDASMDVAVSGLLLNFLPNAGRALAEIVRVLRPGGRVGYYVWDYAGAGLEFLRAFWTEAVAENAAAADLTEARRFGSWTAEHVRSLAEAAGLESIESRAIEVPTVFADFDDFWHPFTLGAGPAPGYVASLPDDARARLRARLDAALQRTGDGAIVMSARAWAVRGRTA